MSKEAASPYGERPAPQGRVARARQWMRRALGARGGHERDVLIIIGKSTLAASLSWFVAHDVMQAQTPAFAPFSAVLIMQVTVYRSLLHALRYVGAVALGVLLQGALGLLGGPDMLTFVLMALAALSIARWRPLGSQGSNVATAAFFAFSTYISAASISQGFMQLGQIILLVLIGCGVGVLVNVLVLPPMRYRGAEYGIQTLGQSLCDLFSDIYPALKEGELEEGRTRHWRHRAFNLGSITEQAKSSVHTAWESLYYNPRRKLQGHSGEPSFDSYQELVDALERVTYQVASMTRSFVQWHDGDGDPEHRDFLQHYGDFIASLARVTEVYSRFQGEHLPDQSQELCSRTEEARERHGRLVDFANGGPLPLADPSEPYGILLGEATRLMEEVQHTCDVLEQAVGRSSAQRS
ncbi:aromatic acid exporter family protein [Streptomyces albidus (ex Kaewkla and Franco 2022)]|uniref:aromatic acid exporter family protein n=1 Tax=Streptomyces albidus (ex Kaewkla and Franco 2022) TaxID=722709 RepID=UPI002816459A|nr:aromatic acid exporter family protein [Streptomyces albidus (ex Kaewkla and Franco 2022)]